MRNCWARHVTRVWSNRCRLLCSTIQKRYSVVRSVSRLACNFQRQFHVVITGRSFEFAVSWGRTGWTARSSRSACIRRSTPAPSRVATPHPTGPGSVCGVWPRLRYVRSLTLDLFDSVNLTCLISYSVCACQYLPSFIFYEGFIC